MNKIIRFAPLVIVPIVLLNVASAQEHLWRGGGPGWGLFGGLLQLLFLVLIILGIIFLVQALRTREGGSRRTFDIPGIKPMAPPAPDPALQILRERLAKGEIDPDDYEARRRVLSEDTRTS
jgi:putative membrane protein